MEAADLSGWYVDGPGLCDRPRTDVAGAVGLRIAGAVEKETIVR